MKNNSKSISPDKLRRKGVFPVTISCLNFRPSGIVHNLPFDSDPPPRDMSVGFWRKKPQTITQMANEIIKKF